LNDLNSRIDVDLLYKELIDNYIIKINESEILSFVHESYLEYFAAYNIFSQFQENTEFTLKEYNENWTEAFQLCIGLFNNIEKSNKFIELLCYGSEKHKIQKNISDLSGEDFNKEIYIAAKVASGSKAFASEAYNLMEKYLTNYVKLWRIIYLNTGKEPIPISNLFQAISILNSEKIYEIIFLNPAWVSLWLCDEIELKDYKEIPFIPNLQINQNDKNILFEKIQDTLITHANKVSTLFTYMNHCASEYISFPSIVQRVNQIKKGILRNVSYLSIKEYYDNTEKKDPDILKKLISLNFTDVSNYNFEENYLNNNRKILRKILENHISKKEARDLIINQLDNGKYQEKDIMQFASIFHLNNYLPETICLIESSIRRNSNLSQIYIELIQNIKWNLLNENIQKEFTKYCNNINLTNILENPDNETECFPITVALLSNEINNFNPTNFLHFNIQNKKIECKIFKLKHSIKKNTVIFLDYNHFDEVKNILLNGFDKNIYNNTIPIGSLINVENSKTRINNFLHITLVPDSKNINKNLILENINSGDTNKMIVHPETIINDEVISKFLIESLKIKNKNLIFLYRNNLIQNYHKHVSFLDYGIVTDTSKDKYYIYFIHSKTTLIYKSNRDNITRQDIVLINESGVVIKIEDQTNFENKLPYVQGKIIDYNQNNSTGFAAIDGKNQINQYYFNGKYCSFNPSKGLLVKFILVPNPREGYEDKFMAIKLLEIN
jgi:hypothetical protein